MAQHEVFKRYALIFTRLSRDDFPSFQQIQEYLKRYDINMSARNLQRDIKDLREEFGLVISYERARSGYGIDKNSGRFLEIFLRFLHAVDSAAMIASCLKDSKEALKFISFDSDTKFGGTNHLTPLLNAIKTGHMVSFVHEGFFSDAKKHCVVRPYLLKEYLGRWYLACKFEHGKKMYSYALDRISDLEISDKTFDASDVPDPEQFFSFAIGVSVSADDEPEEIQLSILPEQIKYLKTLPLHKSQKIVSESKSEVIISLKVVVNFELVQKILMLGERAKVIKPASLVKEIKSTLEEALKRYEQSSTP